MVYGGTLDFYGVDRLFFPKICLVCGKNTETAIKKSLLGRASEGKEKRKDYHLVLPVCAECNEKIEIQTNKELVKSLFISIIGIVGSLILFTYTRSIFMAILIIIVPSIISFFYYRSKVSKRIDLEKYIKIRAKSLSQDIADDVLQLVFQNQNYTKHLLELNLTQNKNLKLVKLLKADKSS